MARSDFPFVYRFRVRYAEVDPQQVVFNSRYLEYADLVTTEFLRDRGLLTEGELAFDAHVAHAAVTYEKPIRADEQIDGWMRIDRIGTSSIAKRIELHGADQEDRRAVIELIYVHVDLATGKSSPVPDRVRAALLP
ncbi:acyl-CoA thioesterase [Brevundimonas sp. VNH65]|uniref:acyl-CoA thioesterase n=1 Tax=Brevundimonas sp. VNH65 TaxID=3400917 RepID=UPI003BFCF68C